MQHDHASGLNTEEVRRRHILPKALAVGVVAGLIACAFRVALETTEHWRVAWLGGMPLAARLPVAIVLGASAGALGVWLVRRFSPEAAGSGIPHLQSFIRGEGPLDWKRLLPIKFFAGVIGIGAGGLAIGREGPTVQMGGAAGLMVSGWFRVRPGEGERKALVAASAGAGLAAAFNAPLAGMIFVLEELAGKFTPVLFVAAFLASVSADTVGRVLTGEGPVFHLHGLPAPTVTALPAALVLGGLCGLGGVVFSRCLQRSLDFYARLPWPGWAQGALAGVLVGVAAGFSPALTGAGGALAERALAGQIAVAALPLLLLTRFFLTISSYGCGAAGGVFAPLLVLGALGGLIFGHGVEHLFPGLGDSSPTVFAVIGMGGMLTAVVRAPLTGIVLLIELTGTYDFMLPLLACCLVAYGVAEGLREPGLYEALRARAQRAAEATRTTLSAAHAVPGGDGARSD